MKSKLYFAVNGCIRCGGLHKSVRVKLLTTPSKYTHFYICPETDEPSLVNIAVTGETNELYSFEG